MPLDSLEKYATMIKHFNIRNKEQHILLALKSWVYVLSKG
jgi:hypothetical protein